MTSIPIILASASPRRRELLTEAGIPFQVLPTDIDETLRRGRSAEEEALRLAKAKAEAGQAGSAPEALVVAADTLVAKGERILNKPADEAEAIAMLQDLRNTDHRVVTALAVAWGDGLAADYALTRVWMRDYTDESITQWVGRGEAADKAGAYAIQDPEFKPAARLEGFNGGLGCYCNVVGLPLGLLARLLGEAGAGVSGVSRIAPLSMIRPVRPAICAGCPTWEQRA